MDDEDLRLNTLNRFAKQSPRLVLEEHSHCEVPAGCGGVVMRWRNPNAGPPVLLHVFSAGTATVYLDGVEQAAMRVQIPYGDHLLAIHLAEIDLEAAAIFLAAGGIDDGDTHADDERGLPALASVDDRSWRATATAPAGDSWLEADFDDGAWQPLTRGQIPAELRQSQRWRFQHLEGLGASPLRLPEGAAALWIRKRFTLAREP